MNNIELQGFKGLGELIESSKGEVTSTNQIENSILNLPIDKINASYLQFRKKFSDEHLQELAESIKKQGIIQPLIVRSNEQGKYEIVVGERRWRAAIIAGLNYVPVIVRNISNSEAMFIGLIENLQRQDLNPIEEAIGIKKLLTEFNITHEEVARSIGRSRSTITNILRLLDLEEEVKVFLQDGKIDMGHARTLLGLDKNMQIEIAQLIHERGLSVRQVEVLIKNLHKKKNVKVDENYKNDQVEQWKQQLSSLFQSNVNIQINQQGKSRVVVSFNSMDELNRFVENVKF